MFRVKTFDAWLLKKRPKYWVSRGQGVFFCRLSITDVNKTLKINPRKKNWEGISF